jgi:multiple sugar transport system substrate-binding protein
MNRTTTRVAATLACVAVLAGATAPVAAGARAPAAGEEGRGPIEIWYSNNQQEIDWATERIDAWNAEHPDEEVSAQEIPAGDSSEEVIAASITAGNTPCLIYNTAPAAVSSFQQQQGLVALDEFEDGRTFIEERLGDVAAQYESGDGQYYQMPWKANPVMLLYNKAAFEEAGLDPENPPMRTHEEFLETARTLVESGAAEVAIYPSPTSQFFQSWFDFYPWFAAETGGSLLVEDGAPTFNDAAGLAVAGVWRQLYEEGLAAPEPYQGDAFADGVSAINSAGPWAVAVYGDVDWGVVPPPTSAGADEVSTFSDAKSVGMYTTCENRQTAWDFVKFTMSEESDRLLLEATGQLPMRTGVTELYADWFEANPNYLPFAEQLARVIEVPNVPNSIEVWQTFRDAWVASVIFGDEEIESAFASAAEEIEGLVAE